MWNAVYAILYYRQNILEVNNTIVYGFKRGDISAWQHLALNFVLPGFISVGLTSTITLSPSSKKKKKLFLAAYSCAVQGQDSGHVLALAFGAAVNPATPFGSLHELSRCSAQQLTQKTPRNPYRSSVRVWYCQRNPGQRNLLCVLIDYICKGVPDSQASLCSE